MPHQKNQRNNRTYKGCQNNLYNTHDALQELAACVGSIYNSLIRSSSALLYAHMNAPKEVQKNEFAIAHRISNTSIHQLVNVNVDTAESH